MAIATFKVRKRFAHFGVMTQKRKYACEHFASFMTVDLLTAYNTCESLLYLVIAINI